MSYEKHDAIDSRLLKLNYGVNREQRSTTTFGLPYLQVNFMIMSNNKVDLGGQKLGAKVDGNRIGAAFDGNKVGAEGNKVGAAFDHNKVGAEGNKVGAALDGNKVGARADLDGNKVGASAMDKVDLEGEGGGEAQGQLEDGGRGGQKRLKNEKSGDSSGNKLIDWKIDFDAAGGALKDQKEEVDHMEDEHREETDKRNNGVVANNQNRDKSSKYSDEYDYDKPTGRLQSILIFKHDDYGTVWPSSTYSSLRSAGMGRILALVAMFIIHFSLSYRTMGSWIPDPRLPIKLDKKRLS